MSSTWALRVTRILCGCALLVAPLGCKDEGVVGQSAAGGAGGAGGAVAGTRGEAGAAASSGGRAGTDDEGSAGTDDDGESEPDDEDTDAPEQLDEDECEDECACGPSVLCPEEWTCLAGFCAECDARAACEDGEICVESRCVEPDESE